MGFYYNQHQEGFYYEEQKPGFYYNEKDGFYYDQEQQGFYYEGFYYDNQGFYYDSEDKFNKENKDYWYKGDGKKRMVKALNGLRTMVDQYVTENPHPANDVQGQALTNVITVQVVKEVIKKFLKNVDPEEYFANAKKNGQDPAKQLGILLAKECQGLMGPPVDYRKEWRKKGSKAQKAMDEVTNELVPFMVNWHSKEPFHTPNGVENAACNKLVAERLIDEIFYEYASKTNPKDLKKGDMEAQTKYISDFLSKTALSIIQKDIHPKSAN